MRVALYLRQSMDKTEGIEDQRKRCLNYASARGWEVVATFEDNAVSASKSRDSAAWSDLLEGIEAGDFDAVVATKVDRLARRVKDVLDLIDMKVGIATLEGELDTTSETGRFQAVLLTALAQLEAERKGQRHKDAHLSRAAQGIPRTTKRPYGWKSDGMTLEPVEADHLRTALRNIIDPVKKASIRGECARMNAAGARTPAYASGSGAKEWTPRTLASVLSRPRMAGVNTYLGEETTTSKITPIVTREEWEAFLALRKQADRLTRMPEEGQTQLKHYLTDVPECPCGQTLRARTVNSRGKKTPYYECRAMGTKDGKKHTAIAAKLLEGKVEMSLYGFMSAQWFAPKGTGSTVTALRTEVAQVEEERDRLTDALMVKGANKGKISAALADVEKQRTDLDAKLERALSDDYAAEWLEDLTKKGEDSAESAEAFKSWFDALDPEKRRALVRGNLTIKVAPGQGASRVTVEPRGK